MAAPSNRLMSLDVFRGATIAGMMLVNNPGDWSKIYAPWGHAPWDGWTYTDTVFPFFLWIVGVAMMLSFAKRVERGESIGVLARHVVWRAGVIFFVGLFLAGVPSLSLFFLCIAGFVWFLLLLRRTPQEQTQRRWLLMAGMALLAALPFALPSVITTGALETVRIPGVLQRIAVCYLVVGLMVLYTSTLTQLIIAATLLTGYWIAMKFIPVPEFGAGVWTPMGNLAWYIDSTLLSGHTWRGAPAPGFDPEGIFSTIPAIVTCMFGAFTGSFLRTERTREEKSAWMFFAGSILLLAGLIMDNWLPINKNLWTSSYSVFMAGLALNVFACCYWILDVKGWRGWEKFFAIYGQNAITMFFLAGFFGRIFGMRLFGPEGAQWSIKMWYYDNLFKSWITDPMLCSFSHSIAFMLFLFAIAWVMYKRNWIIKV